MKPQWYELARLLADHPDIIIATMDTDENEKDPYYLPENFVPNIKLFKKGEKRNYVPYSNGSRNVTGFLEFLGRETGLQLSALMAAKYPQYKKERNIDALLNAARTVLEGYLPANPGPFLCNYFTDPEAFSSTRRPGSAVSLDRGSLDVGEWLQQIEGALASALPGNPQQFLASHFFPEVLMFADHHQSPFGFKPLDREGVELLTPQQEYECWPALMRAISFYKVSYSFVEYLFRITNAFFSSPFFPFILASPPCRTRRTCLSASSDVGSIRTRLRLGRRCCSVRADTAFSAWWTTCTCRDPTCTHSATSKPQSTCRSRWPP